MLYQFYIWNEESEEWVTLGLPKQLMDAVYWLGIFRARGFDVEWGRVIGYAD